ncbi:hypothetical protein B5F40_15190 [Gordonibacter sp. An230]|uniref:Spy0128 family protein n=1 Tax=Gordonibacter sp. An230 TaxID=1965592 RepID=UPI000B38C829|nr:FctA domain-containing protein [Gordonibacter sp. An230]OUO86318.1 hypothetical protein B5F40_15190 [Gordonibacter sp. An230]
MTSMKTEIRQMGGGGYSRLIACLAGIALFLALAPGLAFADEGIAVADRPTLDTWEGYAEDSTENVGRIWTDKTVQTEDIVLSPADITVNKADGADFLVGLSALSSTSNTTTQSSKPLDIVLVLDTSGSMDESFGDETYLPTYRVLENIPIVGIFFPDYYAEMPDGTYKVIEEINSFGFHQRWELDGQEVWPKTSADDNAEGHIQFYTLSDSCLAALKYSVTSFIESAEQENAKIDDQNRKHNIALVEYNSSAEMLADLTTCEGEGASNLIEKVSGLDANGATRADEGMNQARTILSNARSDAQKVVIFFTDGEPTTSNTFSDEVANAAVQTSLGLKNADTLVYSIGVFENANPSDPSTSNNNRTNAFMHAVSSNYPQASAWNNLGVRDEEGDYYKSAADVEELNAVFQEIFDSISTSVSSPTEVEEGFGGANGGYITFTDTLGDYMTVKGEMTVVFANQDHTAEPEKSDDGTTSYHFEGKASNPVYPNGSLSDLVATVTPGANGKGDTVTVKIPASLIPLRNYTVNTENDQTSMSTDQAFPIRIFYSVGLQDGVEDKIANPDAAMCEYIESNTAEDGTVSFFSNKWTGGDMGDTTAEFTPAATNKFYYFTEDTPLYTDEACTQRATRSDIEDPNSVGSVYYKNEFYVQRGDSGIYQTEGIAIPVSAFSTVHAQNWGSDSAGAYMKGGSPRLNRANDFNAEKGVDDNVTGTASKYIAPRWNEAEDGIIVSLGNNGKLAKEVPAALAVNKMVDAAEGFEGELDDLQDKSFDFTITIPGLSGQYNAVVKDSNDAVQGGEFALHFEDGVATHSIKHGETLYVYGLPADQTYTVTEAATPGFVANGEGDEGRLVSGETSTARFTNTYKPEPANVDGAELGGTKMLEGRDSLSDETFDFEMAAADEPTRTAIGNGTISFEEGANKASVGELSDGVPGQFRFGDISISAAGTYTFEVKEALPEGVTPESPTANGVTYDAHSGTITISVTDSGTGGLNARVTRSDMAFVNTYEATPATYGDSAGVVLGGNKFIKDETGGFVMLDDQFHFSMRAQAAGNPMPDGLDSIPDDNGRGTVAVSNKDTNPEGTQATYDFGTITFRQEHMRDEAVKDNGDGTFTKEFQYNIWESDTEDNAVAGITKDNNRYTVTFEVTEDQNTGDMSVEASAVKLVGGSDQNIENVDIGELDFTNTYNADKVTGYQNILKTLNGRGFQSDDRFVFNVSMKATDEFGSPMVKDNLPTVEEAELGGQPSADLSGLVYAETGDGFSYTVTINPASTETGNTYVTNTGQITYQHTGTYVWTVSESSEPNIAGVRNDETTYTVTVKVTNEDGKLKRTASVSPKPEGGDNTLTFTNTYEPSAAEGVPAGFELTKVFEGKVWNGEEFDFHIEPLNDAPMPLSGGSVTVAEPDNEGGNTATFDFGDIKFEKAGTYQYKVVEAKRGVTEAGIAYSNNEATVTVEVSDKNASGAATGALTAVATVKNGTFTNTYQSKLDYVAAGGLQLTKTLNGRDMTAGQFEFTVKSTGGEDRLGIDGEVVASPSAEAGEESVAVPLVTGEAGKPVEFTSGDVGKTFSYEIVESKKGGTGYVNDEAAHKVDIAVTDNGDGTLKATTTVDGVPYEYTTDGETTQIPTVKFVNSYDAGSAVLGGDGEVSIEATKSLTNRPMADGEFAFEVKNGDAVVATGTNDANGDVIFEEVSYDLETLSKDVANGIAQKTSAGGVDTYTYNYTVTEKTDSLGAGVKPVKSAFEIDVVITDDNTGVLKAEVVYPEGTDSLGFENAYGESATGEFHAQGRKVLERGDGLTPPDIAGKYTFAISGSDGAPMPEKAIATNDTAGNVDFGKISFDMQSVFGDADSVVGDDADGQGTPVRRTKTFTYTVTESGDVEGVKNDPETSKTFTVTVTDNGDGTIKVDGPTSEAFEFVNVYEVDPVTFDPTGEGALDISKTLDGRAMNEGEFSFELVEDGEVVSTGTVAAAGDGEASAVSFAPITYTEPGEHTYTLREVNGGTTAAGVDYDSSVYVVKARVSDDGHGGLSVDMSFDGAEAAAFTNTYDADPTSVSLRATKRLTGAELADGQFTFQMLDHNGKVFREAKNNAEGVVDFGSVEFDKAGAYVYTVVEVNDGQEGVTYDDAKRKVVVTVTDDGEGVLRASVEGAEGLAFENSCTATGDMKPLPIANGGDNLALAGTGDAATPAVLAGCGLACAALGIAAYAAMRSRRVRRLDGGRDALE